MLKLEHIPLKVQKGGGGWCGGVHTQTDRFVKREHYGQPKRGEFAKTREPRGGGG